MARRRRRRGGPRHLLRAAIALGVLAVAAVAAAGVTGTFVFLSSCSLSKLRPISLGQNSFVYAGDGSLLGAVPATTNRQPLRLWQMSPWLAKGTVAIEDRRFYQHGGVDYVAIARALVADVKAGRIVEGGSTITQELVRNLYIGSHERTFTRKLQEACLANKLADRLTKRQILAAYLNSVFYGRHAFGAPAAAPKRAGARSRRRSTRASKWPPAGRSQPICRRRPTRAPRSSRSTRTRARSRRWSATCRVAGSCSSTSRHRAVERREAPSSRSCSRRPSTGP